MHMTFTGERYVPHLRGQIYYEHLHRYALALELAKDCDVLDIASGEGYGSAYLAMSARSVVGVDIDEQSIHFAASRYTAMNLTFRVGSATAIPIDDASIDTIVSFETIEHLTEHERMFAEFKRVLRPAGRIIISSPNKAIYSDARGYTNPYHVRELYFDQFRDVLRVHFPDVRLFGHRIFAGSAVYHLGESTAPTRWLGTSPTTQAGMPALPDPEYYIAVCGNGNHELLPDLSSVFLDPNDELLADIKSGGLSGMELPAIATIALGRPQPAPPSARAEPQPRVYALEEPPRALRRLESSADAQNELRTMLGRDSEQRMTIASLRDEVRDVRERNQTLERAVLEWRTVADEYAVRAIALQTALDGAGARTTHLDLGLQSALDAAHREIAELRELADLFVLDRQRIHRLYLTATQRLHEADDRVTQTSSQLDESNDRLTQTSGQLDVANERLAQTSDALAASYARAATLEADLAAVTSSRSWQLTKPIRDAAKSLKRGQ